MYRGTMNYKHNWKGKNLKTIIYALLSSSRNTDTLGDTWPQNKSGSMVMLILRKTFPVHRERNWRSTHMKDWTQESQTFLEMVSLCC